MWRLLDRYPARRGTLGFGLAVALAAVAFVTTDAASDAVLLVGASVGAFAGWQFAALAREVDAGRGPIRGSRALTARAAAVAAGIVSLVALSGYYWPVSSLAGSGVLGLVVAAFVTLPVLYRSERGSGI